MFVATIGHTDTINALAGTHNASVEARDRMGVTALMTVVDSGYMDAVNALTQHGATCYCPLPPLEGHETYRWRRSTRTLARLTSQWIFYKTLWTIPTTSRSSPSDSRRVLTGKPRTGVFGGICASWNSNGSTCALPRPFERLSHRITMHDGICEASVR